MFIRVDIFKIMVLGWVFTLIRTHFIPAVLGSVWWLFVLGFIIYMHTHIKYGRRSKTDASYLDAYREMESIRVNVLIAFAFQLVLTVVLYPYEFFTNALKLGFITMIVGGPLFYLKYGRE